MRGRTGGGEAARQPRPDASRPQMGDDRVPHTPTLARLARGRCSIGSADVLRRLVASLPCALVACGGDAPSVQLVPVGQGPCGRPGAARSLLVTPLGNFRAERRAFGLDAPIAL